MIYTLCYNESEWKEIEQVPIPLPKAASSLSEAKKMKKKIVPMDSWDNPIYPISDPDGQDQGLIFWGENVDFL